MFNQKQISKFIFLIVFVITCVFVFFSTRLQFDYDFEAFFPNEDKELTVYEDFRKKFEHDNEFVLLGIENKKGIFQKEFLAKINSLTKELKNIKDITRVVSPTNATRLDISGLAPIERSVLHFNDPTLYKEDSVSIYSSTDLVGSLFPDDAKSVCVFIKTNEGLSKKRSDILSTSIETTFKKYSFYNVHYVGRIVAQEVYLKNLSKEFVLFLALSLLVVIVFLYFTFRSLYGILIPLIIIVLSMTWTLGIMGILGKSLDIMTIMLPTMIFIAGMSDVVHFFSKYFDELNKETPKEKILPILFKEVGFPTFLTLITTVVGFLSLLFSSIKPIHDFGIYTSVGITVAFILTYTLLPAILFLFPPKNLQKLSNTENKTHHWMQKLFFWIFRNQKLIVSVTLIIVSLSIFGISKIKVNNILLEDLSDKVKIKQDFDYFDQHYSGVRPFELNIEISNQSKIWDYENIVEIDKVEKFLQQNLNMGFMFSPATLVKSINRSLNGNNQEFYVIPQKDDYAEIRNYVIKNKKNKNLKLILHEDGKTARLTGKIKDVGSLKMRAFNKEFNQFLQEQIKLKTITFTCTGAAYLLDKNNEYMVNNMIQGFAWSIGIIAFLTFLLHRSIRMVLVFILPNFIPMLIIAGFMGFAGIELKAATSLIFSIAFGIATDDTIHFISRFKIELGYGKSLIYAFKRTYFETGKPIILTTFILIGGFMSLMTSDFQSIFYFGFLICLTVIIALIAELFLLPVLIMLILKNEKRKPLG
jgi:predicted RND superfamily exporter protein